MAFEFRDKSDEEECLAHSRLAAICVVVLAVVMGIAVTLLGWWIKRMIWS